MLSLEVRCDRAAPAVVRAALKGLDRLDPVRADATLVASELVTNVVACSNGSPAGMLHVTAVLGQDGLLISVHDPGASGPTRRAQAKEEREASGWGLTVVDQLASRWASERDHGYRIWANVPWPSSRSPEGSNPG